MPPVLAWFTVISCPVLTTSFWPPCPLCPDHAGLSGLPVSSILSRMSCPGCPVLDVPSWLPCHVYLSRLSCHGRPVTVVLARCPIQVFLSLLFCPCCHVRLVLSSFSCPGRPVPVVLCCFHPSNIVSISPGPPVYSCCHALTTLSCPCCPVLAVLYWLSCSDCPSRLSFPTVLPGYPHCRRCPVPAVSVHAAMFLPLSSLFPGLAVLSRLSSVAVLFWLS